MDRVYILSFDVCMCLWCFSTSEIGIVVFTLKATKWLSGINSVFVVCTSSKSHWKLLSDLVALIVVCTYIILKAVLVCVSICIIMCTSSNSHWKQVYCRTYISPTLRCYFYRWVGVDAARDRDITGSQWSPLPSLLLHPLPCGEPKLSHSHEKHIFSKGCILQNSKSWS